MLKKYKANKSMYKKLTQKHLNKTEKKEVNKIVKRTINRNTEFKWFGGGVADFFCGNGAGYGQFNMTLVPQPGGAPIDSTRIGDRITLKSIHLNVRLKGPTVAAVPYGQSIRIMIFQFLAPSTTAAPITPSVNNLLLADTITGVRSACSFRDVDHQKNYIMLYDKTYHIENQCTAVGTASNWLKLIKIRLPMKYVKKTIQYSAGGTESANSIWFGAIGSEPLVGAGNDTRVACEFRLRFVDS